MFCASPRVSKTLSGSSFKVLFPHDYPQISLSWTKTAIWQNSIPRCNCYNFSQFTKQEGDASTHDPTCLRACETFSSAFHRLSPKCLFLKTKQPSLPGTFTVTPQSVRNRKKTWSHLLIMPLLRLQRLQKNPQVLRHCVTGLSWFRGRTRLAFCAELWTRPPFHGKRCSTTDFTRMSTETCRFHTRAQFDASSKFKFQDLERR